MERSFLKVAEGIRCLRVPYENIDTGVFLVEDDIPVVIDCATTAEDVDQWILPALAQQGIDGGSRGYLLVTHKHGDHAGGRPRLLEALPGFTAVTLSDGMELGSLTAVALPGHSDDSTAYLDRRTGTLISGDCLQFYGVGRYGCIVADVAAYEKSLERAAGMELWGLLPAHNYVGGKAVATGADEVAAMVAAARQSWAEIRAFVETLPEEVTDPEDGQKLYVETYPQMPPLSLHTIRAVWANMGRTNCCGG